jgi:hypothetical protein
MPQVSKPGCAVGVQASCRREATPTEMGLPVKCRGRHW